MPILHTCKHHCASLPKESSWISLSSKTKPRCSIKNLYFSTGRMWKSLPAWSLFVDRYIPGYFIGKLTIKIPLSFNNSLIRRKLSYKLLSEICCRTAGFVICIDVRIWIVFRVFKTHSNSSTKYFLLEVLKLCFLIIVLATRSISSSTSS